MSLVLIVEDEEALRVLAESIIQHHGYEALSAGTVEQACASRRRPEIRPFVYRSRLAWRVAQEAVKRKAGLPPEPPAPQDPQAASAGPARWAPKAPHLNQVNAAVGRVREPLEKTGGFAFSEKPVVDGRKP